MSDAIGGMRVIDYEAIRAVATQELIVDAVREGFIGHAAGRIRQAPISHLAFSDTASGRLIGDCHIKWGHEQASRLFVIKVATGFYNNPTLGLPSSNGFMLLMSAITGAPLALLADRGWLTDARTAAAGALALTAVGVEHLDTLGILGAGTQGSMQARWIAAQQSVGRVLLWGRNRAASERLATELREDGIEADVAATPSAVAAQADAIVTTTAARMPLLMNDDVRNGTVIVAIGADAHGKRELDPTLLRRAERVICDDPAQCLDHGELQDSGVDLQCIKLLGSLLALGAGELPRKAAGVTVVDLTGIAAQDIFVAKACWNALGNSDAGMEASYQ